MTKISSFKTDHSELTARLREFFRFAAHRLDAFEVKVQVLAEFLKVDAKALRKASLDLPSETDLIVTHHAQSIRIFSFMEAKPAAAPLWAKRRFFELVARACALPTPWPTACLVMRLWPILCDSLDVSELRDAEFSRLIYLLDFHGLHAATAKLSASRMDLGTPAGASLWANLRGLIPYSASPAVPHVEWIQKAENSDPAFVRQSMAESSALPLPKGVWARPSLLFFMLRSLLHLVYICLVGNREQFLADTIGLSRDEEYWRLASTGMAGYWFDVRKTTATARLMVAKSLRDKNPAGVLGAFDWLIFTSFHYGPVPFIHVYFRVIIACAEYAAPLRVPELKMHWAIVHYYQGRLEKALRLHAEVDWVLRDGSNPFNQVINLSSSLRTTLGMRLPVLTNGLLVQIEDRPGMKKGSLGTRSRLIGIIQQCREDYVVSRFVAELEGIRFDFESSPNLPRATSGLLLTLAHLEQGNLGEARAHLRRAIQAAEAAQISWAYRNMISLLRLRTRLEPGRWRRLRDLLGIGWTGWHRVAFSGLLRFRHSKRCRRLVNDCGFYFRSTTLVEDSTLLSPVLSKGIVGAQTFEDLLDAMGNFFRGNFPDFRYEFRIGASVCASKYVLPEEVTAEQSEALSDDLNSRRFRSAAGADWISLRQRFELRSEAKAYFTLACPAYGERWENQRLRLAEQCVLWGAYSVARIDARLHESKMRQERAALETDAQLGQLASQVAHDVRSPLAALQVAVSGDKDFSDEQRALVRAAVQRIKDIAAGLSAQHRVSAETGPAPRERREATHILSMLEQIVSEKRMEYSAHESLRLSVSHSSEAYALFAMVEADALMRVVSNLLNNSVDAGATRIAITMDRSGHEARIQIKDNGKGIPADVLGRIGKRGFSHDKVGGSGLGLFHAKRCLADWQGELALESTEGRGSDAILSLPVCQTPAWFAPCLQLSSESKIVALDDDSSIVEIWKKKLRRPDLLHFTSPQDFCRWLPTLAPEAWPDLFLVNYEFKGSPHNGLDLIEISGIKDRSVLVTSRTDELEIRERCSELGVGLLSKGMARTIPVYLPGMIPSGLNH